MGVEVGAATVPGDLWKAHWYEYGGDLGPGVGQVWTAWQGAIFITFIILFGLTNCCIPSQVGWFTSDDAAVNRTTLCALQNNPMMEAGWKAQDYDMLYVFAHLRLPTLT